MAKKADPNKFLSLIMPASFYFLYSESPYAAALSSKCLREVCSNCFTPAKRSCGKCSSVVYCGKECQANDWPWHKAECTAFVRRRSRMIADQGQDKKESIEEEEFIRILGRTILRLRKDNGIAVLSNNFPSFAKNRSFNDLMSHMDEFDQQFLSSLLMDFREFYAGQRHFEAVSDSELRETVTRIMINDFSVSSQPDAYGAFPSLGVALYLNTSRFNHTCERDAKLTADFDGNKIHIRYVLHGNNDVLPLTEEGFNKLTFSYGFGDSFWTAIPFIQQRRASLARNYFFDCYCRRCENKLEAVLSWDASSRECKICSQPYVLDGGEPGKLIVMCQCDLDESERERLCEWTKNERAKEECRKLQDKWNNVMQYCIESKSPVDVIVAGEPLRVLAERYWHPTLNCRYGQLNEILFTAYRALVLSYYTDHWLFNNEITPMTSVRFEVPKEPTSSTGCTDVPCTCDLRLALKIGEMVYHCFEYQLPDYDYHLIIQSGYLGELFELASVLMPECVVYQAMAVQYYSMALEIWLRRDWKCSEDFTKRLHYRLERVGGATIVSIPSMVGKCGMLDENLFVEKSEVVLPTPGITESECVEKELVDAICAGTLERNIEEIKVDDRIAAGIHRKKEKVD